MGPDASVSAGRAVSAPVPSGSGSSSTPIARRSAPRSRSSSGLLLSDIASHLDLGRAALAGTEKAPWVMRPTALLERKNAVEGATPLVFSPLTWQTSFACDLHAKVWHATSPPAIGVRQSGSGDSYETDILAWSERQAALLKRRAAGELVNEADLDWTNIAEEIESVGAEQLHAVESLLIQWRAPAGGRQRWLEGRVHCPHNEDMARE